MQKTPSSPKVGIIDLVSNRPNKSLWAKYMHANLASIMPQIIGVWCKEKGAEVHYTCYTGVEDLSKELPEKVDFVFITAFSEAAQLAYAISNYFRTEKGCVTILGGPHAKCYEEDSIKYFDYVLGFTHKDMVHSILQDGKSQRPEGIYLNADIQPPDLPGVRERWLFIEKNLKKTPFLKMVPMLGSMGCPYTCSFCIDAEVPYQPLNYDNIKEDLKFLLTKFKKPRIGWHDPNFGIKFNDYLGLIEEVVPKGKVDFFAESSLSILTEKNLKRLQQNGFVGMLPGIESWFDLGNKSRTGQRQGEEKLKKVSEHVNMILEYIPFVQANFVLGLDNDTGSAPFEISKKFVDIVPGVFPAYTLLTSFGSAAPANLGYLEKDRVLPFPFHFLNNQRVMNVKPLNYSWPEFYGYVIDLLKHSYSRKAILRRIRSNKNFNAKIANFGRAISSSGPRVRIKYYQEIKRMLEEDKQFRAYFEGESEVLPAFFSNELKRELGPFLKWLPEGAMYHNHRAYLERERQKA